jgi:hypothetical protein
MHVYREGQDVGEPMNSDPVELVQNIDMSETADNSPNGA